MNINELKKTLMLLTLFLVTWLITSCKSNMSGETTFTIDILEYDVSNTYLGESYEYAWSVINNDFDLKKIIYSIPSSDIETFFWRDQRMVISRNATIRLSQSLGNETKCEFPDMQRGQEVVVECSIEQLQGKFFVVVLNGQNLYGGVVIFEGSARKINIPVIYPLLEDGQLVLTIRPEHAIMKNYQETKPMLKSRIEISSIYDYFYEIGKIK